MKIDDTDRAIVEILQRDGRTPFTSIATEIGPERRVNRLPVVRASMAVTPTCGPHAK